MKRQAFFIILAGILSAYVWVWLFSFWEAYGVPKLQLGMSAALGAPLGSEISRGIFSLFTAALCAVALRLLFRRDFLMAAILFPVTFFMVFLVSGLLTGVVDSLLYFSDIWLFCLFFALCAFLITRFRENRK